MPKAPVLVRGSGLASACALHLLRAQGMEALAEPSQRVPVPVVMLSDAALGLLRDVFGRPDLLDGAHRIAQRHVRWGAETASMPHGGVVVSEAELLGALEMGHPALASGHEPLLATLHGTGPFPSAPMLHFGQRRTVAVPVELVPNAARDACYVEAVEEGWLFLIPKGDTAWLLAVGAEVEPLLAGSHLIAPLLSRVGQASTAFDTAPRQLPQLSGPDWLALGTAALGFDPICGDGSAQAVREAILAVAVVSAMAKGGDGAALTNHYHAMLTASLRRHIQISGQFYASGGKGPWWQRQIADLAEGYRWTTAQLAQQCEPRYVLRGFELVEKEMAL
jgi:hypothetical protein